VAAARSCGGTTLHRFVVVKELWRHYHFATARDLRKGMDDGLGGMYAQPTTEQPARRLERKGDHLQPAPWLGFSTLPLDDCNADTVDAYVDTRGSVIDEPFAKTQWTTVWDEAGSSSEGTEQDDAGFALHFDCEEFDSGSDSTVFSHSTAQPAAAELGPPLPTYSYAMFWDEAGSSSECTDQDDAGYGFESRELASVALAPTQAPTVWTQTQTQTQKQSMLACTQKVDAKPTPAPAAFLPAANRTGSREQQHAGHRAAQPQSKDAETLQPATARHLPRHHPLVGLAGKIQSVVDAPLVCPMCNRHCEEHQRLGFHCE
jgi:hypothetical protein